MNYWLLCLPRPDLEHCIKIGIFGLPRKNTIQGVKQGDQVLCCAARGDWKILAKGEATGDYFIDIEKIFLSDDIYPDRFEFTAAKFPHEIDLKKFINNLNCVTKPAYWPLFFRSGITRLTLADYNLICADVKELEKSQPT